jgi:hypothetical protein
MGDTFIFDSSAVNLKETRRAKADQIKKAGKKWQELRIKISFFFSKIPL